MAHCCSCRLSNGGSCRRCKCPLLSSPKPPAPQNKRPQRITRPKFHDDLLKTEDELTDEEVKHNKTETEIDDMMMKKTRPKKKTHSIRHRLKMASLLLKRACSLRITFLHICMQPSQILNGVNEVVQIFAKILTQLTKLFRFGGKTYFSFQATLLAKKSSRNWSSSTGHTPIELHLRALHKKLRW